MLFFMRHIAIAVLSSSPLLFGAGPAISQQTEPKVVPSALPRLVKNDVGMQFVLVPKGDFLMGSPISERDRQDDEKQHRVRISNAFYLQSTEVTQKQWKAVVGTKPWKEQHFVKEGDDYPAMYVSWDDATEFCKKLSVRDGVSYRLPTEAEWEYACRGGTRSSYSFGDDVSSLNDHGWYDGNADNVRERYAHLVGKKKANGYGLLDMHGNVWEWCADWYDSEYYASSPADDPQGPTKGSDRVFRGGSWLDYPPKCRSAFRDCDSPDLRRFHVGFRVLRNSFK